MRPTLRGLATLSTALILAACSGATSTPTTAPVPATSGPVATSGTITIS